MASVRAGALLGFCLTACNPGVGGAVLFPILANPCDYDGTLLIELSGVGRPSWGGTTRWLDREENHGIRGNVAGGSVQVAFADDEQDTSMKLAGKGIEVFRGDQAIEVPSKTQAKGRTAGSCGYGFVTTYDLRSLAPGRYTLVHRRANGINGKVSCGKEPCTWGKFQGADALVTELVVPAPDELPATTAADMKQLGEERLQRLHQCYEPGMKLPTEGVVVEVDVLPDRAFGKVQLRSKPDVTAPLARCLDYALGSAQISSRPRGRLVARYRVAMVRQSPIAERIGITFLDLGPASHSALSSNAPR